ncbi:sulfotransferase family protein [Mycolicibacterium diernhoferi]|uniref:Sulfotransferase n=1 Tax=Mycolicibacterium diernhoferi TaxID=1801 RepID=A0A1Q4H7E0_9MYCO|nr:sulfotransferase [Mycolicibacterium diernhoferi]OJZ63423.1 sulfotransferase family protein [Mycolicibacterium diernhoferi]OPE54976.1 sulfotransferase family protein [Mycolicibacterium diernhoferi]PEG53997.1 sulfotransferase [Mycolicibacterium diernhoferi]QYL20567.1 sulfotransferase [Mycolicibacterium diernhoferi]
MAAAVLAIEDLTSPVLDPVQRGILDQLEAVTIDLDPAALMAEAIAKTGLEDFGPSDFRQRLDAYAGAVDADSGNTNLNRFILHNRIVRLLSQRLLLTDLLRRYPEIHDIEIEKPIIVVGLPRSGTTHLVNLIAADSRRRALPYWESQEPFPLHGEGPDVNGVDPRFARSVTEHESANVVTPLIQAMHDRFPQAIEEEVELLDLDFASYVLEWHGRVPQWRDFYLGLDQDAHYGYLRSILQALTFLRGPRQWVLKSPQHCEQLGPLMRTFPDATVAFTHRDPVAVIQSAVTMLAYGDRVRRKEIDPDGLVDYWIDRVERLLRACVRDRELVGSDQSVDIAFHHLNGTEMSILETLYAYNGTELTTEARAAFRRYLDDNPRGKHGSLRYDLQGHFGRSPDEIRARFGFYFDRFDVREEA